MFFLNNGKKWLKEALGITEHVEVLYNPCPKVNRREDRRENIILFAGTIIPRKGYVDLIKAFAKIAKKHPDWKVVIAGNGEIENAKNIASEYDVSNQIIFPGWINGKKKEETFQKASIYCLASDGEGFPMGMLDAWTYGIPCVVTPVGGIPDIVKDGINGLIFPVGDIDILASKLDNLISNKELREKIIKAADQYVNNTFSIDNINNQLSNIYKRLCQ